MPAPTGLMYSVSALEADVTNPDSAVSVVKREEAEAEAEQHKAPQETADLKAEASRLGGAARDYLLNFVGSTTKGIVRPVLMPLQTVGRAGNSASMHAIAKSLPGIVRKAGPQLKAEIERTLRGFHDGSIDVNTVLPEQLRGKIQLKVELADCVLGASAPSLFEAFTLNLKNVSRAVKAVGDGVGADEKKDAPSSPSKDANDNSSAEAEERARVTRIAFSADEATNVKIATSPETGEGVVTLTVLTKGGMPLLKANPIKFILDAQLKVWWDTSTGQLKAAFITRPLIDYAAQLHLFAGCCLPRGCTDPLIASIVSIVLGGFGERSPITVPLEVPVAMRITEVAADEEDSLAALPGLVREAARVLKGLTNPLIVDNVVPRAAFRLAKAIVIMTHVRGGVAMWGGGMGSGIMLRKLPSGKWSGPASIGTLAANFGIQMGWRKTDTLLILPTDYHVDVFVRALDGVAQIKLGGSMGVAAGPVGRDAAVDARIGEGGATVCLSYSHSQGLYAGMNMEGEVILGRQSDNEEYYYTEGITAHEILDGVVAAPNDKDAKELYALLDDLSAGQEGDFQVGAVSAVASIGKTGVTTVASTANKTAQSAAHKIGYGLTKAASFALHGFGDSSLASVGPPALVNELHHGWLGTYSREDGPVVPGMQGRLLRLHLKPKFDESVEAEFEEENVLCWEIEAKHGAFFQPVGVMANGECVIQALAARESGEERIVFESQWGRHTLVWKDGGDRIVEMNDPTKSEGGDSASMSSSTAATIAAAPGAAISAASSLLSSSSSSSSTVEHEWTREEEVTVSDPINALSAELRYPWAGTYTRQDGSRVMLLRLEPMRDGSGILGWTIEAKEGLVFQPAGRLSSGGCKVIHVRQKRPRRDKPAVEERLVFESRWGSHTLTWVAGGKELTEENVSGQSRSKIAWAREGPVGKVKEDGLKLW